ncbi:hypothetical protein ACHAW5_000642 [Stephanodiscus triporus]|uniref:Geranylgeranyl diphosphate synthase n=1 Tax=Stephanodiscus triporus TaxID=2934178 RepID=A0ABD3ME30_9STRA
MEAVWDHLVHHDLLPDNGRPKQSEEELSALRYELGVSILGGDLVWIQGPYPAGERVEADEGYVGHPDKIVCPTNPGYSDERRAMSGRARARHETLNGRLKNWGILRQVFRHRIQLHGTVFRACAVVTQVGILIGESLFEVEYGDDSDDSPSLLPVRDPQQAESMAERQERDGGEGYPSPPSSSSSGRCSSSTSTAPVPDKHAIDESLLEPYAYISSMPGKDVRTALIDCFDLWLRVSDPFVLSEIKTIVSSLHDASLLIDDVEDDSKLRRGAPVAHAIFGTAPTINAANYVYFLALESPATHYFVSLPVVSLGRPISVFDFGDYLRSCSDALHSLASFSHNRPFFRVTIGNKSSTFLRRAAVFVSEMLNLHRGQGYDIRWRDSASCPTESQYVGMVIDKTGGLFRLAVGLLQSFASANENVDYVPLVNDLGLYFQIRDDLLNLADEEYMKGKSFCEDLTEGKFSYPIIHCIHGGGGGGGGGDKGEGGGEREGDIGVGGGGAERSAAASAQLLSILKRRTEDADVKRYARRLMIDAGSLRYAHEECVRLKVKIVARIEELGGNKPLLGVMDALHVQVEKIPDDYLDR